MNWSMDKEAARSRFSPGVLKKFQRFAIYVQVFLQAPALRLSDKKNPHGTHSTLLDFLVVFRPAGAPETCSLLSV